MKVQIKNCPGPLYPKCWVVYPASLIDQCLVTFPAGSVWYHVRGGSVAAVCTLRQQQHGQCCRTTVCAGGFLWEEQRIGQWGCIIHHIIMFCYIWCRIKCSDISWRGFPYCADLVYSVWYMTECHVCLLLTLGTGTESSRWICRAWNFTDTVFMYKVVHTYRTRTCVSGTSHARVL